jgi:hypothetical protein
MLIAAKKVVAAACTTAAVATAAHVTLSAVSLSVGLLGRRRAEQPVDQSLKNAVESNVASFVLSRVSALYSGDAVHVLARWDLSPRCVFSDPVVLSVGAMECAEIFRALKCLSPVSLDTPRLLSVVHEGQSSTRVLVQLRQQYNHSVEISSVLLVDVDTSDVDHLVITRFEERWNNVPVLENNPFTTVRRLNGVLSYRLTPVVC